MSGGDGNPIWHRRGASRAARGARLRACARPSARRAALKFGAAAVCAVVFASLLAPSGQATIPLAVHIGNLERIGPGRVSFGVSIAGLQPGVPETIGGTAAVDGETIEQPTTAFAGPMDHFSVVLDLMEGQSRMGGVVTADFPPIPPPGENTPVTLEIVVRQGTETAAARQTGLLLLPIVLVPGYLNEIWGKQQIVLNIFRQWGYADAGPSPNLFWFTYPSRRLGLEDIAHLLAAYVRDVVLPTAYASRFNVVGYSAGGLPARWNAAFDPSWKRLANALFLIAVPNEGSVMSYIYAWYPVAKLARTPAARSFLPTFPFWRPSPGAPWEIPKGAENVELERLNAQPLPPGIRVYAFYGTRRPTRESPGTQAGVTGRLPEAAFSYGTGDGITLTASVLGESINGGAGVPDLTGRFTEQVDLGPLEHYSLVRAALPRIAAFTSGRAANLADRAPAPLPLAKGEREPSVPLGGPPDLVAPWAASPH